MHSIFLSLPCASTSEALDSKCHQRHIPGQSHFKTNPWFSHPFTASNSGSLFSPWKLHNPCPQLCFHFHLLTTSNLLLYSIIFTPFCTPSCLGDFSFSFVLVFFGGGTVLFSKAVAIQSVCQNWAYNYFAVLHCFTISCFSDSSLLSAAALWIFIFSLVGPWRQVHAWTGAYTTNSAFVCNFVTPDSTGLVRLWRLFVCSGSCVSLGPVRTSLSSCTGRKKWSGQDESPRASWVPWPSCR